MVMLTASLAIRLWKYEPLTGVFYWKVSPRFGIEPGDRAGRMRGKYWALTYKRKTYTAARVAWLIMAGEWPVDLIDHINGNTLDDRLINLREATHSQNAQNRKGRGDNFAKVKGANYEKGRFRARIRIDDRLVNLGRFDTAEEAGRAYALAAKCYHGEFARTE